MSPPNLSWLSGSWAGDIWGGKMEEHWTTQSGGTLLGMNRVVKDGVTVHKEFIWIETSPAGTSLSVRVFRNPEETVVYCMVEASEQRVVFQNPSHARLTTMIYTREGDSMRIELEGIRRDAPFREEIALSKWPLGVRELARRSESAAAC